MRVTIQRMCVQEAILTLGSLCNELAWKKYDVTLSNSLANVTRFPDRESYMISMACNILNGYHFEATEPEDRAKDAKKDEEGMVKKRTVQM